MIISCDSCPVRGLRCDDCMVTALTNLPLPTVREPDAVEWEAEDLRVLGVLSGAGLVTPDDAAAARLEAVAYEGLRAVV